MNEQRIDEPETDVAVVGGGLAGLMAALTAARTGARVTLLDARRGIGGRARTHHKSRFRFNEGGHALYEGGEALTKLAGLGIGAEGAEPDPKRYYGITADGTVDIYPMGPGSLLRTKLVGWRGRTQFGRLLAGLGKLDPATLGDRSAAAYLTESVGDPSARKVLAAAARTATYCGDLDGISADAAILQLKRAALGGVRYVHGGWGTIIDALQEKATAAGVTVRAATPVRRVAARLTDGGGYDIEIGPDVLHASAVVLACGSPRLAADLTAGLSGELERHAVAASPVTVTSFDVGFSDGWSPGWVLGIDVPVFVSTQAPTAELAPAGQSLVSTFRYHDSPNPDTDRYRTVLEGVYDRLRPDWRDAATEIRYGACEVVAHDRPRPDRGGLARRPTPDLTDRPGLFVAGDWVGPDGLLADASVASGERAGSGAAKFARSASHDRVRLVR